ncbi:hypothetical protein [Arcobacter aquimarinus]|uniref:Uncharacterized protein n=1 Tax=Arcobacter aquimarinus TaxID=1315211 RepID=A0AAE7B0F7_9BACT|nr:hypothetical protein [Arcobacter aquimarinus]MCB9096410.1 hypothetical protein [Arcobacter sp.]QKE25128.1 hypothetical protein AAQM_0355 [Arcobacter aquimarinus]
MEILEETLYRPKNLENLSKEVKEKIEKKRLSFFQKIFRFFFGKKETKK